MSETNDDITVRKLHAADLVLFRDHLLRLDSDTRQKRFAMGASDDFIRSYVQTSISIDTVIHGYFENGIVRGVGELRLVGRSRFDAEAAFSVEQPWQAQGVGSVLLGRTLLTARNRGIRRLYMNCLATNRHMQRLAKRFGAELEFDSGDVVGLVVPEYASAASFLKEAVSDSYGWATAVFDLQRRIIKTA